MASETKVFESALGHEHLYGVGRAMALKSLDEAELEIAMRRMMDENWKLTPERRSALEEIVGVLAKRRARAEAGLKARITRLTRMAFGVPVTK